MSCNIIADSKARQLGDPDVHSTHIHVFIYHVNNKYMVDNIISMCSKVPFRIKDTCFTGSVTSNTVFKIQREQIWAIPLYPLPQVNSSKRLNDNVWSMLYENCDHVVANLTIRLICPTRSMLTSACIHISKL